MKKFFTIFSYLRVILACMAFSGIIFCLVWLAFEIHTEVLTSWKIGPFIFDYLHKKIYAIIKGFFLIKAISFLLNQFRDIQTIPLVMGEEESDPLEPFHEDPVSTRDGLNLYQPSEQAPDSSTSDSEPNNQEESYQGSNLHGPVPFYEKFILEGDTSVNGPAPEDGQEDDIASVQGEHVHNVDSEPEEEFNMLEDPMDFEAESMGEVKPSPEGPVIINRDLEVVQPINSQNIPDQPTNGRICGVKVDSAGNKGIVTLLKSDFTTEGQEYFYNSAVLHAAQNYPQNARVPYNEHQIMAYIKAFTHVFFAKKPQFNILEGQRVTIAEKAAEFCIAQIQMDSFPIIPEELSSLSRLTQRQLRKTLDTQEEIKAFYPIKQMRELALPSSSTGHPALPNPPIGNILNNTE